MKCKNTRSKSVLG